MKTKEEKILRPHSFTCRRCGTLFIHYNEQILDRVNFLHQCGGTVRKEKK